MSKRPFEEGMAYGVGFDSLSGKVRGDAVVRISPEHLGGSSVLFLLEMITNHSQLSERLNVSASLGNALVGGGSLQAQFANANSIDEYSVYLLAQVVVMNAHAKMRDVRLNDEAWTLMNRQGPEVFRKRYGDEFIVGVTTGGYFGGLIQIHTTHREDKTDISASVRASGGLGYWSAAGDFQSAVSKISSSYDCTTKTFQQGGANLEPPGDIPSMPTKAIQFANSVGDTGVAYYAETLDYTALPLPQGKNPIDVQNQLDVLRQLAEYRSRLYDRLKSVQYVQDHRNRFDDPPDDATLNRIITMLSERINAVYRTATRCFGDYTQCELITDMSMPEMIDLPEQKLKELAQKIGGITEAFGRLEKQTHH
jgi:hypothetical protein